MAHNCCCPNGNKSQATASRSQGVVSGAMGSPHIFCNTGERRNQGVDGTAGSPHIFCNTGEQRNQGVDGTTGSLHIFCNTGERRNQGVDGTAGSLHIFCNTGEQRSQGAIGTAGSPNMFCSTGERRGGLQDSKKTVDKEWKQRMIMCCCPSQGGAARGQGGAAGGQGGAAGHNEDVCHATGERRRDIINNIKNMLDDFDEKPCKGNPTKMAGQSPTKRLGEYDEYLKLHCQSWRPPNPRPPLITSVQTHEIRPTEDHDRMAVNNNEYITYVDARHKPPPPSCDCAKRNGLQDQCDDPGCKPPTEQCLASNPGPCCPPSMGLSGRSKQHGASHRPPAAGHGGFHGQHSPTDQRHCLPSKAGGFKQVSKHPSPGRNMFTTGPSSKGEEMVCFCEAEPDNMPSGKKYMCCPAPPGGC